MTNSFMMSDIVTEAVTEMMMSQVGSDRIGYMALATEALGDLTTQASMVQKLYKETQKLDGVDFGKIPDSKGDLSKYAYYDQLYDTIQLLNSISEGHQTVNLVAMNKLHQILLDARQDFVFGFKSDNYLITNTYKCMVMSLYEMINVCVVDATAYLREKAAVRMNRKVEGRSREITRNVNRFIKMYESGQWATLMKVFKSGAAMNFVQAQESAALEADNSTPGSGITATINFDPITPITKVMDGSKAIVSDVKKTVTAIPKLAKAVWNSGPLGKAGSIIVVLLLILRPLTYLFMHGAAKLKDSIKNNSEILKASITNGSNTVDGTEAQKKLLEKLEKCSDVIEYNIIKSEREASVDMKKADREEFNPNEIRNLSGADFEF